MSASNISFKQAIETRRSIRTLQKDTAVTRERIEGILKTALHTPSAFAMQSSRMVVLLNEEHQHFWKIAEDILKPMAKDEAAFAATKQKLAGFAGGNGTILFFEHIETVKGLQEQFALYSENFPVWAQHGNAMLQYAVWLGLTADGLAASLQHYSPLVDEATAKQWNINSQWRMIAQMPFGKADETPAPREFLPFDSVVQFHG